MFKKLEKIAFRWIALFVFRATWFARHEAKTRFRQRVWLNFVGEKNSPRTSRNRTLTNNEDIAESFNNYFKY